MKTFKEYLEEALAVKGHFVIVTAAFSLDAVLGAVALANGGRIQKKYKQTNRTIYVLSFKTKSDADQAIKEIHEEDLDLVKNMVYTDDLMNESTQVTRHTNRSKHTYSIKTDQKHHMLYRNALNHSGGDYYVGDEEDVDNYSTHKSLEDAVKQLQKLGHKVDVKNIINARDQW